MRKAVKKNRGESREESHRDGVQEESQGGGLCGRLGPAVVDSGLCPSMKLVEPMNAQELRWEEN